MLQKWVQSGVTLLLAVALALLGACGEIPTEATPPGIPSFQRTSGKVTVNRGLVAQYARENWNRAYGTGTSQNPFCDYAAYGGNCANFASQSIMSGLVGSTNPRTVFNRRRDFQLDRNPRYSLQWYFEDCATKGPAWSSAHKLYEYAVKNKPTFKSLHFQLVTFDTPTKFMDYKLVQPGDIIFMDMENDSIFDHTMIVVAYSYSISHRGYNHVRVAYQNAVGLPSAGNRGLGEINEAYRYKAVFHVYRPIDYSYEGL